VIQWSGISELVSMMEGFPSYICYCSLDMVREDNSTGRWLVGEILMVWMLEVLDSISGRFLCDEASNGCNNLSSSSL